ncbi:DUF4255 domain-containing protein [Nocardioides sp.]|uniref:DUF4255 domain-containing protein n=1 Tax=Nocardioides sp. TaxID=35761 RepID=UPI0027350840|nr:DUF4255 domain-containing protein [Nocardioides sp.]MDP3892571.1 DUF4255 domain-containing protein [Nocardioides sp.]
MFIGSVDAALEGLLRARLPLPEDIGDVTFDPPTGSWSSQLSRLTVSLFLYDVQRSNQPSRSQVRQVDADGSAIRRRPQPMMQLSYLVSAWAGSPRDEHQLLGDVTSVLAGVEALPAEHLPDSLSSSVHLSLGDERTLPREVWTSVGGTLKAATCLRATVGADTFDWETEAPGVERIAAMASRMDESS